MSDPHGITVNGYTLLGKVAEGGFGAIYRAIQAVVGREVAIKVVLPHWAADPEFIRRFEHEAQLIARLEHPYIVPLYDYWRDPSGAYLVMRWIPGGSLVQRFALGTVNLAEGLMIFNQIAMALSFAHRRGVVHRDLKPANILLDADGAAYLADFGIARNIADNPGMISQRPSYTPGYAAPEQILLAAPTPQTDIYSLGVLLYELLTGVPAFIGHTPNEIIRQQISASVPQLALRRPDLPMALNAAIQQAAALDPAARYPDVTTFLVAVQQATAALLGPERQLDARFRTYEGPTVPGFGAPAAQLELRNTPNPYKGLRAFQEADAVDFYGRDALVRRLLARLQGAEPGASAVVSSAPNATIAFDTLVLEPASRFLAVVGPSGSGKSSVVRAGLLPALRRGALPGSHRWFIVDMIPGAHPLAELEAALLRVAANPPPELQSRLARGPEALLALVEQILPADPQTELLLAIDQFEELFTLADPAERDLLLASLIPAVQAPKSRLRVIVTLRADFYDRPLRVPLLGELMRHRTEVVLPLQPDELADAIVGPAHSVGVAVEPSLVSAIQRELGEQPGALPLLQYALTELFERRTERGLTLRAYLAEGGVQGALARRADSLYTALQPAEQAAAQQVFLRLVTPGEGTEDTRRRALLSELEGWNIPAQLSVGQSHGMASNGAVAVVLERYSGARLLTFDRDPRSRTPTVEVAHEALIRSWARLGIWLDGARDDLRQQRRLALLAEEWEAGGCDDADLLHGGRLAQIESWAENSTLVLNEREVRFLELSIAAARALEQAEHDRVEREITLRRQAQLALRRSEAQRLAAEANRLLISGGDAELAALLAIHSIRTEFTHEGYIALMSAARLDYPSYRLPGHSAPITRIAVSPDGRYVASGGGDGEIILWDCEQGFQQRHLHAHTNRITDLRFSPSGRWVISCSFDGWAIIWDVATGAIVERIYHEHGVNTATLTHDERTLITGDRMGNLIRYWDLASMQVVRSFPGSRQLINYLDLSPDGRWLVVGGHDPVVLVFDAESGQLHCELIGHGNSVYKLQCTADGQVVTIGGDKVIWVWDLATGVARQRLSGHLTMVVTLDVSRDGRTLLTGSPDRTARLWDLDTGEELRRLLGHADNLWAVAFNPTSAIAFTSGPDQAMLLWDLNRVPVALSLVGHSHVVYNVDVPGDGQLIATSSFDGTVRLWDAQTGRQARVLTGHTQNITLMSFSGDGSRLLTGSEDRTVRLWDVASRSSQVLRRDVMWCAGIALSHDGRMAAIAGHGDQMIWLYDLETMTEVAAIPDTSNGLGHMLFSPDGALLAILGHRIVVRDVATRTIERIYELPEPTVESRLAFSPDGLQLAMTGFKNVWLWQLASATPPRRFTGHTDATIGVCFSPNSQLLLSGSIDGTARLWEIASQREVQRFATADAMSVFGVAFTPDGQRIVTGHEDNTARVWTLDYLAILDQLRSCVTRDLTSDERIHYGIHETSTLT